MDASVEMSDSNSEDETYEPYRSNKSKHVGFIERSAWTRVECFKVAKNLLIYGYDKERSVGVILPNVIRKFYLLIEIFR